MVRVGGEFQAAAIEGSEPRRGRLVVDRLDEGVGVGRREGRAEVSEAEFAKRAGGASVSLPPVGCVPAGSGLAGLSARGQVS